MQGALHTATASHKCSISLGAWGCCRERAARKGRNPKTGEELDIAAMTVPGFTPGKQFKEAVKAASK